jgi:hypothetical protein
VQAPIGDCRVPIFELASGDLAIDELPMMESPRETHELASLGTGSSASRHIVGWMDKWLQGKPGSMYP